jgi:hypothetical protein
LRFGIWSLEFVKAAPPQGDAAFSLYESVRIPNSKFQILN